MSSSEILQTIGYTINNYGAEQLRKSYFFLTNPEIRRHFKRTPVKRTRTILSFSSRSHPDQKTAVWSPHDAPPHPLLLLLQLLLLFLCPHRLFPGTPSSPPGGSWSSPLTSPGDIRVSVSADIRESGRRCRWFCTGPVTERWGPVGA